MGRILVTGATGFVGRRVFRFLADEGAVLRCMTRAGSDRSALAGVNCEFVEADLARPETLRDVAKECSTVVHLAAETTSRSVELLHAVNVCGTAELARAAAAAGVERFVYLSVLNRARQGVDLPRRWALVARSKLAGEKMAADHCRTAILRSAPCFGPGDRLACAVMGRVRGRWPFNWFPGQGTFQTQPIWVEDLARCVALTALGGKLEAGPKELAGPEAMSGLEFWHAAAVAAGAVSIHLHLPETLLRGAIFPLMRGNDRGGLAGLAEVFIAHTASERNFAPALLGRPMISVEQGMKELRAGACA